MVIADLKASDIGAMARFGSSAAVVGGDRFEVGWLSERRRSGSWRCRGEVCGPGLEERDGPEASLAAVRASADVTAGEPAHDLFDALLGAGLWRGLCEELSAAGELVPAPAIGEEAVVADARCGPGGRTWMRKRRMNSLASRRISLIFEPSR